MNKKALLKSIKHLNEENKLNDVLTYLSDKGYNVNTLEDIDMNNEALVEDLKGYFNPIADNETATTGAEAVSNNVTNNEDSDSESSNDEDNSEDIIDEGNIVNFDKLNRLKKKAKKSAPQVESKASIKRKYKVIDNLIDETEAQETTLPQVAFVGHTGLDEMYGAYINGKQLVQMFLKGTLVYDPEMQRGLVEDSKGNVKASFKDSHIKNIADAMEKGTFTPTEIHLGVITDDNSIIDYEYNDDDGSFLVNGKIKILDGQHRVRALVRLYSNMMVGDTVEMDLSKYVFHTSIHVTSSEHAKEIYADINKNLKLDKAQVRHLGSDAFSKIVNTLNQSSNSPLKDQIATSRRGTGAKLVLFNTMTDALEREVKTISSRIEREEMTSYLIDFFDYVAYKLGGAFNGSSTEKAELKKDYLLTENNFFPTWIAIAMRGNKAEYKVYIDKVMENKEAFRKSDEWLDKTVLKRKMNGEGYAMNNSAMAVSKMIEKGLEIAGIQK